MYLLPNCSLTIPKKNINERSDCLDNTENFSEKALKTIKAYDDKIAKLKSELRKTENKRETYYLRTLGEALNKSNLSLGAFFNLIDANSESKEKPKDTTEHIV